MVSVRLERIFKWFGKTSVLIDVNLAIEPGEFFFVLGPSGCGKTTLLRVIAGFSLPDEGKVFFGEKDVTSVAPNKRNAAMVFQHYALFPHMRVWDNVAYGLQVRKLPRSEIDRRVKEVLNLVQLNGFDRRYPSQLSGGQQQRVALARSIAVNPTVLLLDEPLSNLDAKLRSQMRSELKELQRHTGVTTIYVTHDQKEALAMADRMAVMKDGKVLQVGKPTELYHHPVDKFVAEFLGDANVWDGKVMTIYSEGVEVETSFGLIRCVSPNFQVQIGDQISVMVRPEAVRVVTNETRRLSQNEFTAKLIQATYLGEITELTLKVQETLVKAVHFGAPVDGGLKNEARIGFNSADVSLLPIKSSETDRV